LYERLKRNKLEKKCEGIFIVNKDTLGIQVGFLYVLSEEMYSTCPSFIGVFLNNLLVIFG